jgi:hypothetical protein
MEEKDRIIFRTFGQETSDSEHAYASNAIFCGVLHRSLVDLASCMVGQRDNLVAPVDHRELRRVMDSEITHTLYQAICRGSARLMDAGGQSKPMNVWLPFPGRQRLKGLHKVMPGFRWKEWDTHYIAAGIRGRIVGRIAGYLDELDGGTARVSVQALKKALGLTAAEARSAFARALTDFLVDSDGWTREGRSLVRTFGWDGEADSAG